MKIEDIKKLCNTKEIEINLSGSEMDKEKIKIIKNLLQLDNCFLKVSTNEALNILKFLGIPKENLKDSYLELISSDNIKSIDVLKVIE